MTLRIPLNEKYLLTVSEVMVYTGIGENNVRQMLNNPSNNIAVYQGRKILANRRRLEMFLDNQTRL